MNSIGAVKAKVGITLAALGVSSLVLFNNCSQKGFNLSEVSGESTLGSSEPSGVQVNFLSAPGEVVTSESVSFSYSLSGDNVSSVSLKCYLNGAMQAECKSPLTLTALPDNDYTLTVNALNQNGLVLAEAKRSFRSDRTLPVLTLNQKPGDQIGATSTTILFSVADNFTGASSYCSLDNAAFAACVSPLGLSNLALGAHSFKIYAQDKAGNKSATQTVAFSVNLAIPSVSLSQTPAAFSNSSAANFSFSGTSASSTIASYECAMDNGAYAACTSPKNYTGLAEGSHSFSVRAKDALGQMSSAASFSFAVDVTKPSTPVVSSNLMNPSKTTSLNLSFTASDASGVASYECKLDAGAFAACTSPQAYNNLSSASHSLAVRATDKAGNVSSEGSYSIVIDTAVPVVTITSQPASSTQSTSASFAFTVSDALSGVNLIECQLDAQAFANCSSPQSYSNLSVGDHSFKLRGTDKAGNSALASYSWKVAAAPTPTPTPTPTATPVATPPPGGMPLLTVDVEDMEFIGPFASWLNVKSLGAVGNGVADDTAAIQNGLNQVAHAAGGPVILYFPAGTYRITSTLNYNATNTNYGNGMGMIGEHPSTTSIVWDGAAGNNMIVVNGGVGHRFERLTWDGKSKANIGVALWWDATTNKNYGGNASHTDEVFKDMKIGIMAGRLGANYGQLDSEGRVRRVKFLRNSQAGISTGSWNALDWWIFDSEFTDCAIGVTNIYTVGDSLSAGNFLIYRSLFQRSTQADFWIANGGWFSAHNNVSIGSKRFYNAQLAGPSGAEVTLQNNRIIDPTDPTPIYLGNMGPLILIDNQIRSLANSAGPVVKMDNGYAGDVVSIGNSYTINNMIAKKNSGDRVLTISDKVVSANSISTAVPVMPGVAPNKNRQVFEVGSNVNATTIQTAINNAVNSGAENPVVHIGPGSHSVNSMITIPAGKRIQFAGDSMATYLAWSGGNNSGLLSLPGPSLATIRDMTLRNGGGTVVNMTNADQAGGRIFGANSWFAKVSVTNLEKTRLSFQSNTGFTSLDIVGTKSFLSVGSGNAFPITMSGNSNMVLYDAWFEGAEGRLWSSPDGTGNFTLSGAHLAPADSVHGAGDTNPSFSLNSFSGKFSLIGMSIDLEKIDNRIIIGAENANTSALFLGIAGNMADYVKRTSSGGEVGFVSSHAGSQAANFGNTDSSFILKNLEQTRSVVWDTVPAVIPAGATDVRFYNVEMLNSPKALNISK